MSRRSRKHAGLGKGNRLGMFFAVLILVVMVGLGVVHMMVRQYLRSDSFRDLLSKKASEALKIEGKFAPLRWDGLAVDSSSFEASSSGPIRMLKVDDMRTEIGLGGFWRRVWEVQGFRVRRLEMDVDARAGVMPPASMPVVEMPRVTAKNRWMPTDVDLHGIDIGELVMRAILEQGEVSLKGVNIHAAPMDGRQLYQIDAKGGVVKLPMAGLPLIELSHAKLRVQKDAVYLDELEATAWERGEITMAGELDRGHGSYAIQGNVRGVKCDELLTGDWVKRVSGVVSTDYRVVSENSRPVASGHLVLRNGVLTALPVLDQLAAYTDTQRFRVLNLSEASCDWSWREGEWNFSNLVLASEGLVRLEGKLTVKGDQLDGDFRLGIAAGTLASIPGAEEHVFMPGERGLLWAPLRVTGTLSNPQQDLKERLIAAAGRRMFEVLPETGEKVLKFSGKVIGGAAGKGIEGGAGLIEGATGVLDQLFGGKREKP